MALDATSEEFIQLLRDTRDATVNLVASEAAKDAAIAARDIVLASETTTTAAKNAAENSAILAAAQYANAVLLYDSLAAVQTAQTASETASSTSEQHQWVAEANQKTTDSYATEAKNVFVKIYTSVGDGTFTSVDTAEYSALHYSETMLDNSATFALKAGATFTGQVKGITPIAAEDLTRKDYVDLKSEAGTYVPVIANTINVAASGAFKGRYSRVGNIVTCNIRGAVTPTAIGTVQFSLDAPILTAFTGILEASGVVTSEEDSHGGFVESTTGTSRLTMQYYAPSISSVSVYMSFQYEII